MAAAAAVVGGGGGGGNGEDRFGGGRGDSEDAVNGVDVALVERGMREVRGGELEIEERGGGEEEGSEWSEARRSIGGGGVVLVVVPVVFVEHVAEIFVGFYRDQRVEIFGDQLILEHQVCIR